MNAGQPLALVVDDDEIQRQTIAAVLKKMGIRCEVVPTAREFIQKLKTLQPDFCLIDLNIESLGAGFSIIKAVRKALGPNPNLIVVSGRADRNAIAHAMELGANDFIVKPVDRDVLIAKISRYAETSAILEARMPLLPVPDGGAPATFELELAVRSVDEFGIKLVASHLVSKGLALRLEGPFVRGLAGRAHVLLNVTSTWAESEDRYGAYAEFDMTDEALMTSVRTYLVQSK